MPWKECKPMDERFRFIARQLEGELMSPHGKNSSWTTLALHTQLRPYDRAPGGASGSRVISGAQLPPSSPT